MLRTPFYLALHSAVAALALGFLTWGPAVAEEPSFVGTWADDPTQCKTGQDEPGAPMIFTKLSYDQHETHCKFKSVDGRGDEWKVAAECSVEGDSQAAEFALTVSGDTMTMTDEAGGRDLLRCK